MLDDSARSPDPASEASATQPPPLAAAVSSDLRRVWANLDRRGRQLATASAAVFVIALLGLPLSVWDSAQFGLIVLTSAIITFATAFLGASRLARDRTIPLSTIEFWASHVTGVLAVLKLIEILFDFDQLDDAGGIAGLVAAIALVIGAGALVYVANHRGADPYGDVVNGDEGTKVATAGLALFLLSWAFNVSFGFWSVPALAVAVVTLAALVIAEARRIAAPVPFALVGAAIGIFSVILLLGLWGDLFSLGRTVVVLDVFDYLGILLPSIGAVLVVLGGVRSWRMTSTPTANRSAASELES